jgi:hypothetical protein
MRFALSTSHYAANWPREEVNKLEDVTDLGVLYASLSDGPERKTVLLSILRAFYSYLLKYAEMIQRGHLPVYRGHISKDSVYFLRRFLRSGDQPTRAALQAACRTLHLAFPRQSFDEVYNILTGLLIKVIDTYDPHYTDKVKLVVEAINRRADPDAIITGPELGLQFDPKRFLRWMARNGLLETLRDPEDKRGKILGFRIAAWPPDKKLLNSKPIGLAYHIHRWFGADYLQKYITSKMKEVEIKDGMLQLGGVCGPGVFVGDKYTRSVSSDMGIPCSSGLGIANPRTGTEFKSDTILWRSDLDLGKMNLRWVADNKDPLFSRLSRYERQILYLYFSQEQSWKDIARAYRKGIKTGQDDYLEDPRKIRKRRLALAMG